MAEFHPTISPLPGTDMRTATRFMANIMAHGECWIWTGTKTKAGYGQLGIGYERHYAHRLSFTLFVGPIPDGQCVCHACDTPACVAPWHLWLGSHGDNMRDCATKGRNGMTVHPESLRGARNGNSRLTESDVVEIRRLREAGMTLHSLAVMFGVDHSNISLIAKRKSWKHIP